MGLLSLSRICLAVFSVSAITPAFAADPPVPRSNVSVTVSPTTGYYSSTNSTVRLPSGVSVSPSSGGVPVVSRYSGGLQQSLPTGITIDAIKKSAPLPTVVRATTQSVKNAATGCLKSGRCNIGLMLAGQGLQQLFNNLDWVMGDGGDIVKTVPYDKPLSCESGSACYRASWNGWHESQTASGACAAALSTVETVSCESAPMNTNSFYSGVLVGGINSCRVFRSQRDPDDLYSCRSLEPHNVNVSKLKSGFEPDSTERLVSPAEIDSAVDSAYNPDPTDWPALTPQLELNDVEITSAPTLQSEPKTTTVYDADGNPYEITETNIWYDFDIRNNKSSQPALDMKTREETKTYKDGALTGTTTTESTDSAGSAGSGGGGGGAAPKIDIPTDCDFMPTVCAFLDWVKSDDTPEEPDLSALIDDRDFTETYSISGGSKQCPADYEFTVDFIGRTYGLSFEPACDFASKMYYFLMAAAYIFAAYITIGVARNG